MRDIHSIDYVTIAASKAAVDAYILTKEDAIQAFARRYDIPLDSIAAIGHDRKDLAFLQTAGLGFVGVPANASDDVKNVVTRFGDRGYVSSRTYYDAFLDFYDQAQLRDLRFVVTARSGLLKNGVQDWSADLSRIVQHMGKRGWPYVCLLTASSLEQNRDFLAAAGLDELLEKGSELEEKSPLQKKPQPKAHPYLLLVENGALHYNVINGTVQSFSDTLDERLLATLQGEFTLTLQRLLRDDVLARFGLRQSTRYEDQDGAVYVPRKQSMVTVNIPRRRGHLVDYRRSEEASELRSEILGAMITAAKETSLSYRVL